jgi:hypothetical protein
MDQLKTFESTWIRRRDDTWVVLLLPLTKILKSALSSKVFKRKSSNMIIKSFLSLRKKLKKLSKLLAVSKCFRKKRESTRKDRKRVKVEDWYVRRGIILDVHRVTVVVEMEVTVVVQATAIQVHRLVIVQVRVGRGLACQDMINDSIKIRSMHWSFWLFATLDYHWSV